MSGAAKTRWLTPATGYVNGYTHTLNPYVGCSFGCSYCYVRRLPVALFRGEPWGTWAESKQGDPVTIRKEIANARKKGPVTIFLSTATDPYQPLEATQLLTRSLLLAMVEQQPDFVLVQTRSPLVVRDIDALQALGGRVRVSMTIETDLEEVRRTLTPTTPPLAARFAALRKLREAGVPTQAAVSPLLPHSSQFAERLIEVASKFVIDDYFRGDGSGGKRTRALDMPAAYEKAGWSDWYSPEPAFSLWRQLLSLSGAADVRMSAEGFAPSPG